MHKWKENTLGYAAGIIYTSAPPHLCNLYLLITVVKVWHDLEEADFGLIPSLPDFMHISHNSLM